jgi:hypothetical protein
MEKTPETNGVHIENITIFFVGRVTKLVIGEAITE